MSNHPVPAAMLATAVLYLASCQPVNNSTAAADSEKDAAEMSPKPAETQTSEAPADANPVVVLETNKGDIEIELFQAQAPVTVKNFLSYVKNGFYSGTIFHRVIPNFMIQGGGFTQDLAPKQPGPAITNEADNGLKNKRGTIAMARTNVVDSATSQFFINVKNNAPLNHSEDNFGYAVFGEVTSGMDVVDAIAQMPTTRRGGHQDVPKDPVVITSAHLKK